MNSRLVPRLGLVVRPKSGGDKNQRLKYAIFIMLVSAIMQFRDVGISAISPRPSVVPGCPPPTPPGIVKTFPDPWSLVVG